MTMLLLLHLLHLLHLMHLMHVRRVETRRVAGRTDSELQGLGQVLHGPDALQQHRLLRLHRMLGRRRRSACALRSTAVALLCRCCLMALVQQQRLDHR